MAIFDNDLDYTKLIQFSNGTLQLASFVQIRNALIKRFRDIYGNDIDITPASADGQYVNSIALLINNIFQTIQQGYNSLDPAVANGQYLDTLCSYNNIFRILPTNSKAQLYIYNPTNLDIQADKLTFIDKNNLLWIWDNGGVKLKFEKGTYTLISDVICEKLGPVTAPGASSFYYLDSDGILVATNDPSKQDWSNPNLYGNSMINGTIYQTVDYNSLWVWQYQDADVGESEETDEELRSRRYQMLGNNSVTILEGLKGNLLNITGIKDVYIFNNTNSASTTLDAPDYVPIADDTVVLPHSIYVAMRYKEGVKIDKKAIGKIIYNKLTPGIKTSQTYNSGTEEDCSCDFMRTDNIVETIYWKKCSPVSPEINISTMVKYQIYDYPLSSGVVISGVHPATSGVEKSIVKNLQNFIYDIKINDYLTAANIINMTQLGDIQKNGMNTFFVQSATVNSAAQEPANLSYFKYDDLDYLFTYTVDGSGNYTTCTITVGGLTSQYILLNATSLSLEEDDTFQLSGKILPTTAGGSLTYSSSNSSIASVSATGLITGGSTPGTATITVTDGTSTATCSVTVTA